MPVARIKTTKKILAPIAIFCQMLRLPSLVISHSDSVEKNKKGISERI